MSTRGLRKRIQAQQHTELQDVVSRLADNPGADVTEHLRRLKTYTEVLTFLQPRWSRETILSICVAILSIGLAGLLWGLRVSETRITIKVDSGTVALKLTRPWSWSGDLPLDTSAVTLEYLATLTAPELFSPLASERGDAWIHITGGNVSLVGLQVKQDGILELEKAQNEPLGIYARGAALSGQLMVGDTIRMKAGVAMEHPDVDTKRHIDIPETIVFHAEGTGAVPVRLRLRPRELWLLRNLYVQELRFTRQIPTEAGEIAFISTVKKGTVTLHDVAEHITLQENEPLTLTGVRGRLVELRSDDTFTLQFEGTVQKLSTGPADAQVNLAPSLLKYYYHQEPLTFFWSAVVFIWGILWSIRKTVFR
jgi:hypothetical protein